MLIILDKEHNSFPRDHFPYQNWLICLVVYSTLSEPWILFVCLSVRLFVCSFGV